MYPVPRATAYFQNVWNGVKFQIIDTGGIDPSEGGKEPLSISSADFIAEIRSPAMLAVERGGCGGFVTDATSGITPADQRGAELLRRNQKRHAGMAFPPIILRLNKADNQTLRAAAMEFYALGLGTPFPISALHGTGTGDLLDMWSVHSHWKPNRKKMILLKLLLWANRMSGENPAY
jgi:GTP-binding protein